MNKLRFHSFDGVIPNSYAVQGVQEPSKKLKMLYPYPIKERLYMEPAIDGSILPMLRENADSLGNRFSLQILKNVQVLVIDNDKDSG